MKLKNIIGHFKTITKHRWEVFKLSVRAGIPLRGLMHDYQNIRILNFGNQLDIIKEGKEALFQLPEKILAIQKHGFIIEEEISIILNIGMTLIQSMHLFYHLSIV